MIKIIIHTLIIITSLFLFQSYGQRVEAASIQDRVAGYILLQAEDIGQAWYVHPGTKFRHYLGRPSDAFAIMRHEGLGITTPNLTKIPIGTLPLPTIKTPDTDGDGLSDAFEDAVGTSKIDKDTDGDGYDDLMEIKNGHNARGQSKIRFDNSLTNRVKGKILLQVENRGEAWYVYPKDGKRYFLGNPLEAHTVMRLLSLGITNNDLSAVPRGDLSIFRNNSLRFTFGVPSEYQLVNNTLSATRDGTNDGSKNLIFANFSIPQEPSMTLYVNPPPIPELGTFNADIVYHLENLDTGLVVNIRDSLAGSADYQGGGDGMVSLRSSMYYGKNNKYAFRFQFKESVKDLEYEFREILNTFREF